MSSGGKAEVGARRAALVQLSGIDGLTFRPGRCQFYSERTGRYQGFVIRLGYDQPNRRGAPAEIRLLAEDVNNGAAQNSRDGSQSLKRIGRIAVVAEPVAEPVPDEIVDR